MPDDDIIEDPQVTVEPPKKKGQATYNEDQIIYAMTIAEGDLAVTAEALKIKESLLRDRVEHSRKLKGAWHLIKTKVTDTDKPAGPTMAPGEMHTRNEETKVITSTAEYGEGRGGAPKQQLANETAKQDLELLIGGLEKTGISAATITSLRDLSDIKLNTGMFLVTSLDLIHRSMIRQAISLFEEAQFIKKTYLRDMQLAESDRQGWQRHYTEICEQLGKASDRILAGTQALVQIHNGKKPSEGRNKGRNKYQEQSEAPGAED